MSEIVGGSFTGVTVSTNVSLTVRLPSLTVTVIVVVPDRFATGVRVTVRAAPDPPNRIFAFDTRVVSEELPVTVKFSAGVSKSQMVKGKAPVGVSSGVV